MRFFRHLVLLACCLAAGAALARPSIQVQRGDWGSASREDIAAVLASVAGVLLPDFPQYATVRINVAAGRNGPRVLEAKAADGAYQVELDVRDTRWDQFAYQFSHELCHIVSNYDRREIAARPHQWLEETLCEVVSVVALKRLAARWQDSPPHAGWESYAPAFARYAQRLLEGEHRSLPPGGSLSAWYNENRRLLAAHPYLRASNELAATTLLDVFEAPGALPAIGYLNLDAPGHGDLAGYLAAWHDCCPEAHRAVIERLISLLGA